MLLSLYNYFRFCFRHIQTYLTITQEHTHAYSKSCVSQPYSEPWHIPITRHIQTPWYIHTIVLKIFTKALPWTFDIILNAPPFYTCCLTSGVILKCL